MADALAQFPQFSGSAPPSSGNGNPPPPTTGSVTIDQLLQQANTAFADAQKALAAQDLATYQAKINEVGSILDRLAAARAAETGTTPKPAAGSTASSSTTSTTRPSSKPGAQALGR